tara:strand:+ start:1921 stop:2514 length:594 start_codon:yes stop_codon:yes gene_type:complete
MRAQIGQNVDPRLGILDFSPQAEAARTDAASRMALGSAIGEALTEYKSRRDDEKTKRDLAKKISGGKSAYMLDFLGLDDNDDVKGISSDEVYNVIKNANPKEIADLYKTFFLAEKKAEAEAVKNMQPEYGDTRTLRNLITDNQNLFIDDKNGVIREGKKKGPVVPMTDPSIRSYTKNPSFRQLFPGYPENKSIKILN